MSASDVVCSRLFSSRRTV